MAEQERQMSAQDRIYFLLAEKKVLQQKLAEEVDFNRAAWSEYGSELCANELGRNVQKIRDQIAAIDREVLFCERYLRGEIVIDDRGRRTLVASIEHMEHDKANIERTLGGFRGMLADSDRAMALFGPVVKE